MSTNLNSYFLSVEISWQWWGKPLGHN